MGVVFLDDFRRNATKGDKEERKEIEKEHVKKLLKTHPENIENVCFRLL